MLKAESKKTARRAVDEESDDKRIEQLIEQLENDYRQAELSDADRKMLDYSSKLTVNPQSMNPADVQELRDVGFNDLAIHDIVCCISYFAFVNRIADGLGVELESSP